MLCIIPWALSEIKNKNKQTKNTWYVEETPNLLSFPLIICLQE